MGPSRFFILFVRKERPIVGLPPAFEFKPKGSAGEQLNDTYDWEGTVY